MERTRPVTARPVRAPRRSEALWFYLMAGPWIVGFVVLTLGPMIVSVWLSMTDWDLFSEPAFIGLDNYVKLFTADPIFWKVLGNTAFYAFLSVPLGMAASLGIAYLLNKPLRLMRVFRTAIYLPTLVPLVATSILFVWIFAPDTGLINTFLALFGIDGPAWLLDEDSVKPALIIMSVWQVGTAVLLLLAGMQSIPKHLYEAAALDGAGPVRQFWHVTLPMLTPVIFFNLVMGIIGAFQVFAQVYIMTESGGTFGGPDNASQMVVPLLFQHAFKFNHMGYASAIAWVLFAILLLLTLVVIRSSSLWVFYESEVKRK
ncbi:sugar ABC transporter permease [Nonomuraea sp. NN258]|uniref:carbohydrate ABC transporter permease n=1 Tax=Nonomuraea antri TaxID=2730852 RepID=UPI001569DB77|nr:sugar ABC transporter permease [Nonomuraea antri]NRQ32409.1 sugar ABC transporter permease [Nonomuraea antri]